MKPGWYWPYVLCGFLAIPLVFDSVLIYSALSDPSFAVEEDYYRKALAWDQHVARQRDNAELGWQIAIDVSEPSERPGLDALQGRQVSIEVTDSDGNVLEDVQVEAIAFAHARAANKHVLTFARSEAGHTAALFRPRSGRWQFRLVARRGETVFTNVQDLELP